MHLERDNPCPICGATESFDISWLATKFQDGTELWGRVTACVTCGVLRFYKHPKPADFQGTLGTESVDPLPPPPAPPGG